MFDLLVMEIATLTCPQCFKSATALIIVAWEQALAMHPDSTMFCQACATASILEETEHAYP